MGRLRPVKRTRTIRTLRDTVTASDATVLIHHYNAVSALVGGVHRTSAHTGRVIALHAGPRQEVGTRSQVVGSLVDTNPFLLRRYEMHRVAGFGTVSAAVALRQIDHHHPLLIGWRFGACGEAAGEQLLCARPDRRPAGRESSRSPSNKSEKASARNRHGSFLFQGLMTSFACIFSCPGPHLTLHSIRYSPALSGTTSVNSCVPSFKRRSQPWSLNSLIVKLWTVPSFSYSGPFGDVIFSRRTSPGLAV